MGLNVVLRTSPGGDEPSIGYRGGRPIGSPRYYPVPNRVNELRGELGLSEWHPFGCVSGNEPVIQFRGIGVARGQRFRFG